MVELSHSGGEQRVVIELELLRGSLEQTTAEGVEQTSKYMSTAGTEEGHPIIFHRDPNKPWEQKISRQNETYQQHSITVRGM